MKHLLRFGVSNNKILQILLFFIVMVPLHAKADTYLGEYNLSVGETKKLYVSASLMNILDHPDLNHWGSTDWTTSDSSVRITERGKDYCKIIVDHYYSGVVKVSYDVYWADYYYNWSHSKGYYEIRIDKESMMLTANPSSGTVAYGTKVTLSTVPSGANIYYTLDGSNATTNSTLYTSEGIIITESCTLKALAVKTGCTNATIQCNYTVSNPKPSVSMDPSGGKVRPGQEVSLCAKINETILSAAQIYYTTDGTTPSKTNGTLYTDKIVIDRDMTIKAIAYCDGYPTSDVEPQSYICSDDIAWGVDGNITWDLSKDGVLTLSGEGKIKDYDNSNYAPWYDYRKNITSVIISDGITNIGDRAFYFCYGLTNVTIPNSITSIGSAAFWSCYGLTNVTIPNSVTSIGGHAFQWCSGITNITIPNSITSIGDYAFSHCSSLTNIAIPGSVTSIGSGAFGTCTSLESIEVSSDNPNFKSVDGVLYSKDGQTLVASPGSRLTIEFLPNVKTIGACAFMGCSGLTNITIPNSVTSIGGSAFRNCM